MIGEATVYARKVKLYFYKGTIRNENTFLFRKEKKQFCYFVLNKDCLFREKRLRTKSE